MSDDQEVTLYFGGMDDPKATVRLPHTPDRLQVGKKILRRVDDPETGDFLGLYVAGCRSPAGDAG